MSSRSLKDAAVEFLTLAASAKVSEAYERHVGAGFRHHNPNFRGDAASLMQAMQENATRNPHIRCWRFNALCRTVMKWPSFLVYGSTPATLAALSYTSSALKAGPHRGVVGRWASRTGELINGNGMF